MLSKSLIQFSVEGWGCVPLYYLTWGQTMVEVIKIMVTSFQKSHAGTVTLSAPNPAAGHCRLRPLPRLLDTHGQVWVSLLWGHCSFLLGPGVQKVLFVPSKSLFPQSSVSSGDSMVGLRATSSKRAYATPKSAAPRAPAPAAVHCWPVPPQETLKHGSVSVSVRSLGPGAHKVCLSPLSVSGAMGFDSKHDFAPPTILMGLLLCPSTWGISSKSLQHCAAAIPAPAVLLGLLCL